MLKNDDKLINLPARQEATFRRRRSTGQVADICHIFDRVGIKPRAPGFGMVASLSGQSL